MLSSGYVWNTVDDILDVIADLPEFVGMERPSVNSKGGFGNTPLKIAAVWGDPKAIEILAASGAILDTRNEHGLSALHYAAQGGHLAAVRKLVELGAPTSQLDDDGRTPVQLARILNRTDVVDYLSRV